MSEAVLAKIQQFPELSREYRAAVKSSERLSELFDFRFSNPVEVEGYTAAKIHAINPRLSVLNVYNFLAELHLHPDLAKQYLAEGAPIL